MGFEVLRQKGFGAGYDMVTVIIGNYVWHWVHVWMGWRRISSTNTATAGSVASGWRQGYSNTQNLSAGNWKGERLQTPMLELHFWWLKNSLTLPVFYPCFSMLCFFDPFRFSRCCAAFERLNCAQCQVVLEVGPNDLPWPDDAKSKEKGVTVCALCFGCRGLAVWLAFRVATRP